MKLHLTLKRYRTIYVVITLFFMFLGWDAWNWFKDNHGDLSEAAAAGFISIFLAIIAVLKFALENARQDDKHD